MIKLRKINFARLVGHMSSRTSLGKSKSKKCVLKQKYVTIVNGKETNEVGDEEEETGNKN